MFMRSFSSAENLPAIFRMRANAAAHELDCLHASAPGTYCARCQVYHLERPVELPINCFLDRRIPFSVPIEADEASRDAAILPYLLAFMDSPTRRFFQVTSVFNDWAGWMDEKPQDEYVISASLLLYSIPAPEEPTDVDELIHEWVSKEFFAKLNRIKQFENQFTVDGDTFTIVKIDFGPGVERFHQVV